jgi:hypothetical protein
MSIVQKEKEDKWAGVQLLKQILEIGIHSSNLRE